MIGIEVFPDEILLHILSFLSPESPIWAFAQANHHLYTICSPHLYRYNVDHGNSSALNWAADNGRMDTFQKLLDAGAPLPSYPTPGKTKHSPIVTTNGTEIDERLHQNVQPHPASLAARGGHEAMVELMTNRGVLIDLRDPEGFTLLALAASHGHTSLVRLLLSRGARQDIRSHGSHSPLCLAAFHGHGQNVTVLYADLKANWAESLTEQAEDAVWAAVVAGHTSIIKILVEQHNAPVNFVYRWGNGMTPLSRAAADGRADMVRLLLQLGAEVEVPSSLSSHPSYFCSPLVEAVVGKHDEVVQILFEVSSPNIRTRALSAAVKQSNLRIAELLLNNGTRPEFSQEDIPEAGKKEDRSEWAQPLLLAVTKLDLDMASLLLNKGADPNVWCSDGPVGRSSVSYRHVLSFAVEHGNKFWRNLDVQGSTKDPRRLAMVDVLLHGGADPNQVDEYGQPPLSYAIRAGDETLVQCLLEYGADPRRAVNQLGQKLTSVSEMKESIRVMLEDAEAKQ